MSAAEKADFARRFYARRERLAATAVAAAGEFDAEAAAGVLGVAPTGPGVANASELPDTLRIGRNLKNTLAEAAANSTLAEPAAINNRGQVLYAGKSRSFNQSWSYLRSAARRVLPMRQSGVATTT